ncbi:MAG: phosphonoacetate hydrolase [Betaproteobacteria bacterium]|nr:phosphonoacetate hydrolase [Betaproteobacteria bacterium]
MLTVNGRRYHKPKQTTVVVCVDGCEPDYVGQAVAAGQMPWMQATLVHGTALHAEGVIPSFTNPNNVSIVTGVPPSMHGICGNYLFDPETQREVMMNDPKWLRAPTIFAAMTQAGVSVAIITAKDKLRRLLGHGLQQGICFSAEKADQCNALEHGIEGVLELVDRPLPAVYSADLSEFVFASALALLRADRGGLKRPDILYLSTTDYIQHKYAPGSLEAHDFYRMLDQYLSELEAMGCVIAVTADHGMNAKIAMDGKPDVIYLQDWLDEAMGAGKVRAILPITDPYVVHHAALGSFATLYLQPGMDAMRLRERLQGLRGMERVLLKAEAALAFELPADRIGDLVCLSERFTVIGTSKTRHDLSGRVPLIVNRAISGLDPNRRWRNFDAFDLALNHAQ